MRSVDPDDNCLNTFYESVAQNTQSDYYSVEKMKLFLNDGHANEFFLLNCNIRSFHANSESLLCTISSLNFHPSIIILTETWLNENNLSLSNIEGYTAYHVTRPRGRGGGVSVFIRCDLTARKLDEFCLCNDTIEVLTVEVKFNGRLINLVAIYRPHSDTISSFSTYLGDFLANEKFSRDKTILAGDFNIDLLNYASTDVSFFSSTLYSLSYLPTITKPTRFPCSSNQRGSPSLLDHIWTNNLDPFISGILATEISDHAPTFLNLPYANLKTNKIKVLFRDKSSYYNDKFFNKINSELLLTSAIESVSDRTERFISKLNHMYCECFPL